MLTRLQSRRGLLVLLAAFSAIGGPVRSAPGGVDPEVRRALSSAGATRVCVALKDASRPGTRLADRVRAYASAHESFLPTLPAGKFKVHYRYRFSPVVVIECDDPKVLDAIDASPAVASAGLDPMGSGALNESRALIHANEVFDMGIDGTGRVVAVLDTGVDTDHPDLAPAIVHQHHFLNGGSDQGPGAEDGHGHGTNVTGIIASRGTVAPRGVAPGADIVAIKVLDNQNRGFLSDWAAGVEYVVSLHESPTGIPVDAINMSLVSDTLFSGECDSANTAFANACEAARQAGIAVFVASGNKGGTTQMTMPACFSASISVGSVPDSGVVVISSFTSRNALLDLLAPGEHITSTGVGGGTSTFTGTSQACPHAVAVACLLRQVSPAMSPDVIRAVLRGTGVLYPDTVPDRKFPRIDALAAITAAKTPGDCNENGVSDLIDVQLAKTSADLNENGIPDECEPTPGPVFRRGDANQDAAVDLSDAVRTFLYLFSSGTLACGDSADSNDDGEVDISDGIYVLNVLFQGGPDIPAPGVSSCGIDPTADSLGCESYTVCP